MVYRCWALGRVETSDYTARQAAFESVSATETNLARDLVLDKEWAFFERFFPAVHAPNERRATSHRIVRDGIFWIARIGAPWRDLTDELGKQSSVYRHFRRRILADL